MVTIAGLELSDNVLYTTVGIIIVLFFIWIGLRGRKDSGLAKDVKKGEQAEKTIEKEETEGAAEAAQEIAIEEREKKEEMIIGAALTSLDQALKQSIIRTEDLPQLQAIVQTIQSQVLSLQKDHAELQSTIGKNEQTLKISISNLSEGLNDVSAAEKDVASVVDVNIRSRAVGILAELRSSVNKMKETYETIGSGIINRQKQNASQMKTTIDGMPVLSAKLAEAIKAGKNADAIKQDEQMLLFTRNLEVATKQLEADSQHILTFNQIVHKFNQQAEQNWIALDTELSTPIKQAA